MGRGDDEDGLAALDRTMAAHARGDDGPGMAWLVVRGNDVHVGAAFSVRPKTGVGRFAQWTSSASPFRSSAS